MFSLLRSTLAGAAAIGVTGALSPVVSLLSLKDPRAADPVLHLWGRALLRAAGVRATARGIENLPVDTQCVVVLNHQSHFDGPVLFAFLRKHLRYVAKGELFRIPVFGQAMKLAGNLRVDRGGGPKDRETLHQAAAAVRERVSIVFFAEGTRSEDGRLLPFKKGAAALAIQAGVPVVPMALAGTRDVLPRGSLRIRTGKRVALVVGKPIPTEGLSAADRGVLTERVREAVVGLLRDAEADVLE